MAKTRRDFEQFFRDEYPSLVRALVPITGDVGDAEAIVQDAFVKAMTRWERIRRYDRPGAWVRRVAIRDGVRAVRTVPPTPRLVEPKSNPLDQVPDKVDLFAAVRVLPPHQRAAVALYHLAGWPTAEIADALGCAEPTVRVHLHRGRKALAAALHLDPEEAHDGPR